MKSPLVSIVMPTYNRCALIGSAINSVLAQNYTNWELIIVDDGSTDNTVAMVAERYGAEPRIKLYEQTNSGQGAARNRAIGNSAGEFIAFLDSDNMWREDRLDKGVAVLLQNKAIGLCYSDETFIDINGGDLSYENMRRYSGYVFPKLIVDNFISLNTVLMRRTILPNAQPFNAQNRLDEDYELWLELSVKNEFFYIPEKLVAYRVEGERVSNQFMDRLKANAKTIKKIIHKYNLDTGNNHAINNGLSRYYLRCALIEARHGSVAGIISALYWSCRSAFMPLALLKTIMRILLVRIGVIS